MALVLPADPEFVHFDKVSQDEVDRVLDVSLGTILSARREVIPGLATEIIPQEQSTNGMLHTTTHFHHVLHDLLDGSIFDCHVYSAHGDHEIQTGYYVSRILHEFIEVGQVVDGVGVSQVLGQVSQGIEDGHVEFIVLLGTQGRCPELRDQGRAMVL